MGVLTALKKGEKIRLIHTKHAHEIAMDQEAEFARLKWLLCGGILFLVSGWFTLQEFDYKMSGRDAVADVTKTYQSRGRRGSTNYHVEYAFTEPNGTQRKGTDTVSASWSVPPDGKIPIRYTPGANGNSRLTGKTSWAWIWVGLFALLVVCIGVFVIRLLLEAASEPPKRRRRRRRRY